MPDRRPRPPRPATAPGHPAAPPLVPAIHPGHDGAERLSLDLHSLPPPFQLHPLQTDGGYTWSTFIHAYAGGRWDPHRTPRPPRPSPPEELPKELRIPQGALTSERPRPPPLHVQARLRTSFSAVSSYPSSPVPPTPAPASSAVVVAAAQTHLDAQTSAATLRWAGARVRVAPLALPSPEHELVDPMRRAGAVPIPGSHPDFDVPHRTHPHAHPRFDAPLPHGPADPWHAHHGYTYHPAVQTPGWDVMTPGGTRRARLSGFWSGTADVDEPGILPTIDGSPTEPDDETASETASPSIASPSISPTPLPARPPPATAPVRGMGVDTEGDGDYFGIVATRTKTARRASGLRTPPATREGSVEGEETEGSENGDDCLVSQEPTPLGHPGSSLYSEETTTTTTTPGAFEQTTPDSNPARPTLGRAVTDGAEGVQMKRPGMGRARTVAHAANGVAHDELEEREDEEDEITMKTEGRGDRLVDGVAGHATRTPKRAAGGPASAEGSDGDGSGDGSEETLVRVAVVEPPSMTQSSDAAPSSPQTSTPALNGDANSNDDPNPNSKPSATQYLTVSSDPHAASTRSSSYASSSTASSYASTDNTTASYASSSSYASSHGTASTTTGALFLDLSAAPHSVPAPVARRVPIARQMSAPLPAGPAVLGGVAWGEGGWAGARAGASSEPGRDAWGDVDEGGVIIVEGGEEDAGEGDSVSVGGSASGSGTGSGTGSGKGKGASVGVAASGGGTQKAEGAFAARGFLAPPYPPDELGRRRALYKFNIMNTGQDMNFDRIAHLAKLVFNTKGVVISVVDGESEWFKSEWGLSKAHSCARAQSFCGHAILQRGDEPMIVLDSRRDWRFAQNPLVLGAPNIRFYAGAPLRTQDGFNIGCLALIDDAPREDFTPRQRHTLKEFAAIAMREMELWRDKIQLRIRDRIQNSMEQFSRECLEIDSDAAGTGAGTGQQRSGGQAVDAAPDTHVPARPPRDPPDLMGSGSSMDKVYDRAAKLVQRTLDVEGVMVMDLSHCEVLESMSAEGTVGVVLHHGDPDVPTTTRTLSVEEYARLNEFFARYPEGKISEGIVPPIFRLFLQQSHIQYALTVPIYNIDKRPFALLCAWNASEQTRRFLEGHELSYLRAIGVIILSAVLKRRMILADKAKGLFISNISHELRTPLHGILAAAELLGDSSLNHSQLSFLQTVQACGTSLVETVNHVLDFTKLSGNSKAGGVENVIIPTKVDLMQLVEEAVDGCWIGHRARTAIMGDSGIGSVYSPPEDLSASKQLVETVVEIGWRKGGWLLKCEKGGIRRVLMNVFGNSLKFTTNGYVHVILRELPRSGDEAPNETKVELVVLDTGKGISENFRKNQLFHPFSQENPLQTGTGLGLAIVNSIVKSDSVHGKVDVWSEEGVGTEIKVTFDAQILDDEGTAPEMEPFHFEDPLHPATVSLVGFGGEHKGMQLLLSVVQTYLVSWWGFEIRTSKEEYGEIVILNEDIEPVKAATAGRDTSRPFIILSTLRGNPNVMAIASEHERIGGFCRIIYKPGGPSRLHALLKLSLHAIRIGRSGSSSPLQDDVAARSDPPSMAHVLRRNSEEHRKGPPPARPVMTPRSMTAHPAASLSWKPLAPTAEKEEPPLGLEEDEVAINVGTGGTLLRSSVGTVSADARRFRVLVVEDNSILRNLLVKWLTPRGYDYRAAVDGRNGVDIYESDGPFDVVLLDMSMPILDGIGATTEIRQLEKRWLVNDPSGTPTRILALTGMSSLEDKRRAFEAGVDGYLVKPVAFKTLDEMFSRLGVS